ncbi:MAG: GH3 auxin-responsive promoter family protein [Bacteroidota bacterium]|nr:GH3 auxin-responsive promoter family protein [Bacteroidota bacterium]
MPIPLFNSIASWFLKKRIHQIQLFMKYPNEVQQELLHNLLNRSSKTEIGLKYDFATIKNYEDFKNRLPIVNYEQIFDQIERCRKGEQNIFWSEPIKWFAKSSGTTNAKSKFIPVSFEALEDCHYKAGKDMLSLYFNNNENAQMFTGKCLRLGGSRELYKNTDSYFGDLSAIIIDNLPFWAELSSTPSQKVSLMSEWESKMKAIIEESINENVTSLAGVPSWMLVLLKNVLKETNKESIFDIWPSVEVYFHGGVSFRPYKSQFNKLFNGSSPNYYEIYNASEGFFAIQDMNNSEHLLLMLDYGIFYEFIPVPLDEKTSEADAIIPLSQVELKKNYAIVITTNAGLWRYKIGDTVKFTSLNPYRIKITGRTKNHINVFGEELMVENADVALTKAAKKMNLEILDYTAGPIFMGNDNRGGHEWIIEFKNPPNDIDRFAYLLDQFLKNENSDYEAKRYKDIAISMPKIKVAKRGLFYNWLKSKNKLGGQHKIPRLSNNRKLLDELKKIKN